MELLRAGFSSDTVLEAQRALADWRADGRLSSHPAVCARPEAHTLPLAGVLRSSGLGHSFFFFFFKVSFKNERYIKFI